MQIKSSRWMRRGGRHTILSINYASTKMQFCWGLKDPTQSFLTNLRWRLIHLLILGRRRIKKQKIMWRCLNRNQTHFPSHYTVLFACKYLQEIWLWFELLRSYNGIVWHVQLILTICVKLAFIGTDSIAIEYCDAKKD